MVSWLIVARIWKNWSLTLGTLGNFLWNCFCLLKVVLHSFVPIVTMNSSGFYFIIQFNHVNFDSWVFVIFAWHFMNVLLWYKMYETCSNYWSFILLSFCFRHRSLLEKYLALPPTRMLWKHLPSRTKSGVWYIILFDKIYGFYSIVEFDNIVQIMAGCLTAPSHHLHQWGLNIHSQFQWHSYVDSVTTRVEISQ